MKFAPHTTNSLVSLRVTCAGLYFVVIDFFLDIAAPQAERRETRASEFNKERAGWAQWVSERAVIFIVSRHKWKDACRPYFRPICRSSRKISQKSFLRCQTNDAHAQWANDNDNNGGREKSAWTEMKETQVYGCHQRSDVWRLFFPLSHMALWLFSLRYSQSSAEGCNTAANFIGSIALVLKLILAAFYILLHKKCWWKREKLWVCGDIICSVLTQGNCFYCWRHTAYFYCAAIQWLPFSQKSGDVPISRFTKAKLICANVEPWWSSLCKYFTHSKRLK